MKEKELRQFAVCGLCNRKIGATGLPLFYRVTVERFGIDLKAIQRQQGLTMMLGGHAEIAAAMGPDEELALPLMEPVRFAVCEDCSTKQHCVAELAECTSSTVPPVSAEEGRK